MGRSSLRACAEALGSNKKKPYLLSRRCRNDFDGVCELKCRTLCDTMRATSAFVPTVTPMRQTHFEVMCPRPQHFRQNVRSTPMDLSTSLCMGWSRSPNSPKHHPFRAAFGEAGPTLLGTAQIWSRSGRLPVIAPNAEGEIRPTSSPDRSKSELPIPAKSGPDSANLGPRMCRLQLPGMDQAGVTTTAEVAHTVRFQQICGKKGGNARGTRI